MNIDEFRAWLRQPATVKSACLIVGFYLLLALLLAVYGR